MRWDFGKILRQIRLNKGLTQEEVCGEFLDRSYLARIEGNQTNPSFEKIDYIFKQLGLSYGEFEYLCNDYHVDLRAKIIKEFHNYIQFPVPSTADMLTKKCEIILGSQPEDLFIQKIRQILKQTNAPNIETQTERIQIISNIIWNDLSRQDEWYLQDIELLSNSLYHYPLEQIEILSQLVIKRLQKYENFVKSKELEWNLLANISVIYLRNGRKQDALKISSKNLVIAQAVKRYDFYAQSLIRVGICTRQNDLIIRGIEILEVFHEKQLLESMKSEIEEFYCD